MEELTKKLTDILDSPEGMAQIQGIADMLLKKDSPDAEKTESKSNQPSSLLPAELGVNEINTIMRVMGALKSDSDDQTTALLYALKPHLKPERQKKIDGAIKLLRLYRLLPLLKEGGIFD